MHCNEKLVGAAESRTQVSGLPVRYAYYYATTTWRLYSC